MQSWKILKAAMPYCAGVICLVWLLGQALRDGTWLSGLMFYLPTPVLSAWLSLLLVLAVRRRSRLWLWYTGCLVLPVSFLCTVENQWLGTSAPEAPGPALRLVHWNLCRTTMGWAEQRRRIQALNPDLIVLSETSPEITARDFPGFQIVQVRGMLIAARGPMHSSPSLVPGGALLAFQIHCDLESGPLDVMIVDMTSNILVHRDLYLQRLLKVLNDRVPAIVVGDFNAPRRSLAFSSLPQGFRHAYDEAGSGWSYTWPVPVPFLAIDQCILGPGITAVNYQLESTLLSDHRIQILDFQP